jgi:threonine aldolase/nitrogen-specific signal transduction histidine kinase
MTTPTASMLAAIQSCTLRDDVMQEDDSTRDLEEYCASITGKEAGLFVLSGTMGNQLALRALLTQPPHGVLCDHRSHIVQYEAGGVATLTGALVKTVVPANGVHLTLEDVKANVVLSTDIHSCPTKVISLENTLNGMILPLDELRRIAAFAREHGIHLHCDGARLWEAVAAGAGTLREFCAEFDTVTMCFSKGLGAPVGSVLVGTTEALRHARWTRKAIGGGMLVVVATVRVADGLVASLREANRARQESERRASLLSTVLRTNSLDPQDVLRATTSGLMEAGLDVAVIRTIDHERRVAVLVDGVARDDVDLEQEITIDEGPIAECIRLGRQLRFDRSDTRPGFGRWSPAEPLQGCVLIPLFDDGEVSAVAAGASSSGPVTDQQVEAAELLAGQAARALARAGRFDADRRTLAELRRLDVRTQDFVSTVSHELRTPLTVIDGLGRTLLSRWDDLDEGRRSDLLRRISANAERLSAMVRSLLDSSTLESGEFELERVVVPLRSSLDALLHRLASVTADHPVRVDVDPALQVEVDPNLFEHVLENLLANVAKHTPRGTRVEVCATRIDGDRVEVSVTDQGPGIAAADVPHVLDRFYRGGEPDRRPSGGLGLGLALSSQIVQAHGSELRVVSGEGEGTRFSFEVPAAR